MKRTLALTPQNRTLDNPLMVHLATAMANTYALYLKTQGYHWNVEGPQFLQLHALFEAQYRDMAGAVDEIAERIRALGGYVSPTFMMLRHMSSVEMDETVWPADEMVRRLIKAHDTVCASLDRARKTAIQRDDAVTEDLMVERLRVHEKQRWMLRSIVGAHPTLPISQNKPTVPI